MAPLKLVLCEARNFTRCPVHRRGVTHLRSAKLPELPGRLMFYEIAPDSLRRSSASCSIFRKLASKTGLVNKLQRYTQHKFDRKKGGKLTGQRRRRCIPGNVNHD